jgi:hypothetical protein
LNEQYLSAYTKLEYLFISYFDRIEIVEDLSVANDKYHSTSSTSTLFSPICLLHVIDIDQAPKFVSERAFQRFQLAHHRQSDDTIETLKDMILVQRSTCVSHDRRTMCLLSVSVEFHRIFNRFSERTYHCVSMI